MIGRCYNSYNLKHIIIGTNFDFCKFYVHERFSSIFQRGYVTLLM